jgi:hypothetical protein
VTAGLIAIGDPPEADVSIPGETVLEDNAFIGLGAKILARHNSPGEFHRGSWRT